MEEDGAGTWSAIEEGVDFITYEIATQTAKENGGVRQMIEHEEDGKKKRIVITSKKNKLFTILVKPPKGWESNGRVKDVRFAFSTKNLYMLGFLHKNKWKFFNDADLEGTEVLKFPDLWERMPQLDGGYKWGDLMTKLASSESSSLDALSNYDEIAANVEAVWRALYPFIVVFPEAARFSKWKDVLMYLLLSDRSETVNECLEEVPFQDWSTKSKLAICGDQEGLRELNVVLLSSK
ncbi:hypothetical protein PR202_gb17329 [Eleusine coracana subsp. coracana]|uniref:rRNA N-glycosylase n=1 Tax=Eleusine coracana subsp. coracana TaxID=191504 RepID=A0AAV5F2P9_ELECO|nr:hypothetical protein PR202_gb17329 [Eleusine coracana subsp. coracana]